MTQTKKELVLAALNNESVDRVPVGFWFHYTPEPDHFTGLEDEDVIKRNIAGHKKYYEKFKPDFVKLMSDGYFTYPNEALKNVKSVEELKNITSIGANNPWIEKQVELVRQLTDIFGNEVLTFYNVFSPARYFGFLQRGDSNKILSDFIKEDRNAVKHALDVIADDLAILTEKVITVGKVTGIYLSVQNILAPNIDKETYEEIFAPGERKVIAAANRVSENNILHICGYHGHRNDLTWYEDYDIKAVNWAVTVEKISLSEGKRIFGGRAVIGGFDNTDTGLLYRGSKEEIELYTENLIKEAGKTGVILGADCTVPPDIDLVRFNWVRDAAATL